MSESNSNNSFEIISREPLYEGFFRMYRYQLRHQLFQGGMSNVITRELFERGDAAALLPYDPITNQVILIEQFRLGAVRHSEKPWLLEIAAGIIEKGEKPEHVASRELLEEAGLEVQEIIPICDYIASPGGSDERVWLYCGKVTAPTESKIFGNPEENEDIKTHILPLDEAHQKIFTGEIVNPAAIITLQWAYSNQENLRRHWCT